VTFFATKVKYSPDHFSQHFSARNEHALGHLYSVFSFYCVDAWLHNFLRIHFRVEVQHLDDVLPPLKRFLGLERVT